MEKLIFLLLLIGLTKSQLIINSPCRDLSVKQNFDIESYMGKWYEIEKYQPFFESNGSCITADYSLNTQNDQVNVINSLTYLNEDSSQNVNFSLNGIGLVSFPEVIPIEGKFNVSFFNQSTDRSNYWVLDTDYENYSVVWSCEELTNGTAQGLFVYLIIYLLVKKKTYF